MDKEAEERLEKAIIKKPRRVKPGALKRFRANTHDLVPELENLTDEDLEDIINWRNKDDLE